MQEKEKAYAFITAYLNKLRYIASPIPQEDRGFFPKYWYYPYQIFIHKNTLGDIVFDFRRKVSGKSDKIAIRFHDCRIEETVFPNLNYRLEGRFNVASNVHCYSIIGITFKLGTYPFFTIGTNADIKFKQVRLEASVSGYPMEKELLWVFTTPYENHLTTERAEEDAINDFWQDFGSAINTGLEIFIDKRMNIDASDLFIRFFEKLKDELNQLITRKDLQEAQLQQFFEAHYFLLSDKVVEKKIRSISKGRYFTDFTLDFSDGTKKLVEIQLNNDPIIKNGYPSKGFAEALEQLTSWFQLLEKNNPEDIGNYKGLIVIGRKNDYEENKEAIINNVRKIGYPVDFLTYDRFLEIIDSLVALFKNKAHRV